MQKEIGSVGRGVFYPCIRTCDYSSSDKRFIPVNYTIYSMLIARKEHTKKKSLINIIVEWSKYNIERAWIKQHNEAGLIQ
jgi:hypothetical protein